MKPTIFLFALLTGSFFFVTVSSHAQTDSLSSTSTINASNTEKENLEAETQLNEDRRDNADALNKEYKAKAKEARRVEKDASYASKQARKSAKMEKQAQKSRKNADKQSKKADRAADKSDNN